MLSASEVVVVVVMGAVSEYGSRQRTKFLSLYLSVYLFICNCMFIFGIWVYLVVFGLYLSYSL